ncbi:hypothetical protein CANTEDRAFT_94778 [Yamadazyma tenuis ATCC 10573]|uniref:Uncharacterized protein n=2 Tax=Candida tenuis TaxID=2315449 RepID=G3B9J2_CANTC|nr:uncharacterized protein CANTEDRAFT_94778 [Yamadazyma tenuis ATCC 10573]EGV61901.1 hypothetical protein CANTEDRAFT_94778 [Yamadazyma tenuis ATCC 10573]
MKTNYLLDDLRSLGGYLERQNTIQQMKDASSTPISKLRPAVLLPDNPKFILSDFIGDFDEEVEFGRNLLPINADVWEFTGFSMPFEDETRDNITFDLDFGDQSKEESNTTIYLDPFDIDPSVIETSTPGPRTPISTPETVPAEGPKKRRFALIEDSEMVLGDEDYIEFIKNYEPLMKIGMLKFRRPKVSHFEQQFHGAEDLLFPTTPQTPEVARHVHDTTNAGISGLVSGYNTDNEFTYEDTDVFDLSFPEINISEVRSSSQGNIVVPSLEDISHSRELSNETRRFYNHLLNVDRDSLGVSPYEGKRISFSSVCPTRCPKSLVAKSLFSILELATNSVIGIECPSSLNLSATNIITVVIEQVM